MLSGVLAAAAMAGWVPFLPGLLLAVVWWDPVVAAPLVAAGVVAARRSAKTAGREPALVVFHRTLASELRAGLSLRLALVGACRTVPQLGLEPVGRLAAAGRPLEEVAAALARSPQLAATAAALRVAAGTGGSVAPIFDALTAEAFDDQTLRMEQRSLTVQARLSVAIVAGFPLAVLGMQLVTGEWRRMVALGPVGVALLGVGTGLLLAGLGTVGWLLSRARR